MTELSKENLFLLCGNHNPRLPDYPLPGYRLNYEASRGCLTVINAVNVSVKGGGECCAASEGHK